MFNLSKQLSFIYVTFGLVAIALAAYFIGYNSSPLHKSTAGATIVQITNDSQNCDYNLPRLGGYHYIKPLMFAEQECESERYLPLKNKITGRIEEFKRSGVLKTASVYFKDLNNEAWMSINGEEKFDAHYLRKIPLLITVLRVAEDKPGFMDQAIFYDKSLAAKEAPIYDGKSLEPGRAYPVHELLEHMIAYSDDNAATLLLNAVDGKEFTKTYKDLGLPAVKKEDDDFKLSFKQYSVFLKVLYDGGYLTFKDCEYAISLLTKCNFKDGLVAGIPNGIKVAHKFEVEGPSKEGILGLHEAAIIYLNNKPYSLTVMVQGADLNKLPSVMKSISKLTFDEIAGNNPAQ